MPFCQKCGAQVPAAADFCPSCGSQPVRPEGEGDWPFGNPACPAQPAAWKQPTWHALDFAPRGPLRFHYSFQASGQGRAARFTVRAEGDPDCSGKRQAWELTGAEQGPGFVISAVKEAH